jgi:hypothetical protein
MNPNLDEITRALTVRGECVYCLHQRRPDVWSVNIDDVIPPARCAVP